MAVGSTHNGWRYDKDNSRLDFYYRGTRIGAIDNDGIDLVAGKEFQVNDSSVATSSSLDSAYNGGQTITVDAADVLLNLATGYNLQIKGATSGTTVTGIGIESPSGATAMTDGILFTATATITDAIDASSANITNALNIGANVITGTYFGVSDAGAVTAVGVDYGAGTLVGTGNIAINTAQFTVNGTSGNTVIAGTLDVTGTTTLSALSVTGAQTFGNTVTVDELILDTDGAKPAATNAYLVRSGNDNYYNAVSGGIHSITIAGTAEVEVSATQVKFNGNEICLDADDNTSITADTDNQIDIAINGADDFTFTANSFNVLSGSVLALADNCDIKFGDGPDAGALWSTADASAHALVIYTNDTNNALHIANAAEKATDWNLSAATDPTVYIHCDGTNVATDYMALSHDDSNGNIAVSAGMLVIAPETDVSIGTGKGLMVGTGTQLTISDGDGSTNLIPEVQAVGVGAAFAGGTIVAATCSTTNDRTVSPKIALVKGGAATQVATTAVADNEVTGSIISYASDGADFESPVGAIEFVVDEATPAAGVMGGSIEFYTTAVGGETLTKAATIDVNQNLIIENGNGLQVGYATQETVSNGDGSTNLVPEVQILGTGLADSSLMLGCWSETADATACASIALVKSGNAAIGSHTVLADNEVIGKITAFGDDGTDLESPAAEIRFVVDDTPTTGQMGGSIEFYTTADAGETLTKALTIDVGQNQTVPLDKKIQFNDTATYIFSDDDGYLDLVADTEIRMTSSIVSEYRVKVENHTADDTLTVDETGSMHTNYGDIGAHTLTLPDAAPVGTQFTFVVGAAQQLNIKVGAASEYIIVGGTANQDDGGADGYIWADDEGETLVLTKIVDNGSVVWLGGPHTGTWTWAQP